MGKEIFTARVIAARKTALTVILMDGRMGTVDASDIPNRHEHSALKPGDRIVVQILAQQTSDQVRFTARIETEDLW